MSDRSEPREAPQGPHSSGGRSTLTPIMRQRLKALQRYMQALENGDLDTLAHVLREAEHDRVLEQMVLEMHASEQESDIVPAQLFGVDVLTDPCLTILEPFGQSATEIKGQIFAARKQRELLPETQKIPKLRLFSSVIKGKGRRKRSGIMEDITERSSEILALNEKKAPKKGPGRIARSAQLVAAVLIAGVLVGAFGFVLQLPRTGPGAGSGAIVAVASAQKHTVYGLRPSDGKKVWEFSYPSDAYQFDMQGHTGWVLSPGGLSITVQKSIVYVAADCSVYALNATNGKQIWHQVLKQEDASVCSYQYIAVDQGILLLGGQIGNRVSVSATPSNDNQNGTVNNYHSSIRALNASDGNSLWQNQEVDINSLDDPFTVSDGVIYATAGNNRLVALNVKDGKTLWEDQTQYQVIMQVTEKEGVVYTTALNNETNGDKSQNITLQASSAINGKALWSKDLSQGRNAKEKQLLNKSIIADKQILILEAIPSKDPDPYPYQYQLCSYGTQDGKQQWCSQAENDTMQTSSIESSQHFILKGETLYASFDGRIEAFNVNTGKVIWSSIIGKLSAEKPITTTPGIILLDDTLYYGEEAGGSSVAALNANTGKQIWQSSYLGSIAAGSW
jgi:outer membrane protein assembly factor BamB